MSPPDSSSSSSGIPQFKFVTQETQSGARSHAMKEHWKRRHQRNKEAKAHHRRNSSRILPLRSKDRFSEDVSTSEDTSGSSELPGSGDRELVNNQEKSRGIPSQLLCGVSYALSSSRPDPFQTCPVHLTNQHQKLLHHWISTHAAMMFEDLNVTEFNPMKDVWFPLDLSNASSFNCVMAHSAAHLYNLYAGTPPRRGSKSSDALKYKIEAVKILRLWLSDPEKELSDDSFAAVVRLLTYERYWGTVEDWKIHRDGLQRMIDSKGGVEELHENWRLQLVVYLVSLMTRPSWLESTNNLELISRPFPSPRAMQKAPSCDVHKVRCLWLISFIQDMRTFMGSFYTRGLSAYPFTHLAVGLLRDNFLLSIESSTHDQHRAEWEDEMLWCLFCISVLMQESISLLSDGGSATSNGSNTLLELELSLRHSNHIWTRSIHDLRSILYDTLTRLFEEGQYKVNYFMDLVQVLGTLSLEARQGVEKCLLNLLYCLGNNENNTLLVEDGWSPDSLLSSMHGN